ncbi:MAG TPA: F0F1 ATP synthase subunit epsilon [Blastocatellia bacterium]|jgi:F-type H+-transporting ATPase subunit epsilon|nr:F0F1 ATP synthase subunit epsilon [Blastocatellia bacterium]
MPDKIHLEVVTPERKVFEAEVDRVDVPGLDGELGILPGHTELISQLKPAGLLTYYVNDQKGEMAISDGFVEVSPDRVVVLADKAERPEDIDLRRALEYKEHAERQLQRALSDPDIDIVRATIELERASIELQLAEKANR